MKNTFCIHNPLLLRYLFQLRVGLSRLRYHKKRHKFADTPTDTCLCNNGIEDTHHYLLKCPFYRTQREFLTSTIENILRKNKLNVPMNSDDLYLYGHACLNNSDNRNIIIATLEYIKSTNRLAS